MATPFVGEIRMTGFNFAPEGWALCNGQILAISENEALFTLLGTTYGGDGVQTFALPDLQCRIPFHQGSAAFGTLILGQAGGEESVTLNSSQIPSHVHRLAASSGQGTQASPLGGVWAGSNLGQFSTAAAAHTMAPTALGSAGGGQPHDNLPPFLVVNFIISLYGIYPSQN